MPKLIKPASKGPHMLAPMSITRRAARFLASTSKRDGKSTANLVREGVDLMEQLAVGNAKLVITDRDAFAALQKKQGRT